jgi:hypothetical protein
MSHLLARLLCVAAVGALAMPVFAQAPQADQKPTEQAAPAAASPTGAGGTTAVSPEEKAARAACESKMAAEKDKCLKDVDAKYNKATTDKMAPSGDMSTKPKDDTTKSGYAK